MTLLLTRSDIVGLVGLTDVIGAVRQTHHDLATGAAALSAPHAMRLGTGDQTFVPMSGVSGRHGLVSAKLLADMPSNRALGLSVQRSTVMLISTETGECVAVLDGREPTRIRTAAASAVATGVLSRPDSRVLGLIGAGALAVEHLRAICLVRDIRSVLVWSRSPETLTRFIEEAGDEGPEVTAVANAADVVYGADVLCTLTPSREPVVEGAWMTSGLHVNAVGAPPRPDHREIDTVGMKRSRIVVDSRLTVHETGDLAIPLAEGALTEADVSVELGEVIAGLAPGRADDEEITLFKSVGVGLQDLAICQLIVERARAAGVGSELDLTC